MRRILLAIAALVVLAAIVLVFRPAPVSVDTGRVTRGELRVTVEEEGKTRVRDRFVISTPAAGRLLRVNLEEGDSVREGDVVVRLEPVPLDERTRAEARARLQAAEAARRASDARVKQVGKSLEQARRSHKRADELAAQGLRSPEEREQVELAEATLSRELDSARFAARAAAYEAELARATLLAEGVIAMRAPVTGRVLRILQESERSIPAGTPVLEVGDPANLEVVIDLLSTDAVRVRPGAAITLDGGEGRTLRAHVRTIEPSAFTKISALGVEEQRVNVIGDFDEPAGRLGDSFRVEASITIWQGKDVLKVPASALFRRGQGWSVFAVERGRARRRDVEIGHRNAAEAEVVRGLAAGDAVVLHPSERVQDGSRVRTTG